MGVTTKWLEELEGRLKEIENKVAFARNNSTELNVKVKISKEAVDYVGTEQNLNEYVKKNYHDLFVNQRTENELKIQELLNERNAINGLIEVINFHIENGRQ